MSALDIVSNRTIVGRFANSTDNSAMDRDCYNSWRCPVERLVQGKAAGLCLIYCALRCLRLLYIPLLQFTSVLTEGTNPFTLISSLLIGLAMSLVAATVLYYYFRNRKGDEVLKH